MPNFNPFDMDMDGDVDGIDFLGFDYLMRHVLRSDRREEEAEEDDNRSEDEVSDAPRHGRSWSRLI